MRWAVESLEHPPQITASELKSGKSQAKSSKIEDENKVVKVG
jgi:hypothetical protein